MLPCTIVLSLSLIYSQVIKIIQVLNIIDFLMIDEEEYQNSLKLNVSQASSHLRNFFPKVQTKIEVFQSILFLLDSVH